MQARRVSCASRRNPSRWPRTWRNARHRKKVTETTMKSHCAIGTAGLAPPDFATGPAAR